MTPSVMVSLILGNLTTSAIILLDCKLTRFFPFNEEFGCKNVYHCEVK